MKLKLHVIDSYKYNFPQQIFGWSYNLEFQSFYNGNRKLFKPHTITSLENCMNIFNLENNKALSITNINNSKFELRCFAIDVCEDFDTNKDYRLYIYQNLALALSDMNGCSVIIKNVSYENSRVYIHIYKIPLIFDGIEFDYDSELEV